ncbi:MAG: HEAT repeat domain-containing protein [Brevinemataceae bacterium]
MKQIIYLPLYLIIFSIGFAQEAVTPQTTSNISSEPQKTELEKWTEIMEYGIGQQRLNIVKKIRSEKRTNYTSLLEKSYSNENNISVKEEIIYTFIDFKMNSTDFWGRIFSTESNMQILQRAAYAVEKMDVPIGKNIFDKLSQCISNNDAFRFNASAVRALGKLKYREALPLIQEIATNKTNHQDLTGSAVAALGMYQDATILPLLQSILTNTLESKLIRRYAAMGIGMTKSPDAAAILSPIALDESEEQSLRLNAISGLGCIPNPETINIMESLSKSDNTAVRTEAIKSLGKMNAVSAKKILEFKAENDPDAIVKKEAKNALTLLSNS